MAVVCMYMHGYVCYVGLCHVELCHVDSDCACRARGGGWGEQHHVEENEICRMRACYFWSCVWTLYGLDSLQQVERCYALCFFSEHGLRCRVRVEGREEQHRGEEDEMC